MSLMSTIRRVTELNFYKPVPVSLPCETVADLVYLLAARCDAVYPPTAQAFPPRPAAESHRDASLPEAR